MTLTRDNVTAASRVMLPTYVVLFGALGINYTLAPPRLAESPTLAYAGDVLALQVWGAMFLLASLTMAGALIARHRLTFRLALWVGLVCLAVWTLVFLAAAVGANASATAPVWPAFAAIACYASDRSLLKGEV